MSRLPFLAIAVLTATFFLSAVPQSALASTGPENRGPSNGAETNARNLCVSDGWQALRYGAIWITESPANYYDATVNIAYNQNSVPIYIAGSVFGCHNTATNDTYAVGVQPQGANGGRITSLGGTSLYRGTSQGQHNWSTQGTRITATLDVSGIAANNQNGPATQTFIVDLYRCFSTNPSTPTGSCFAEPVPITVTRAQQPQPQVATVEGRKVTRAGAEDNSGTGFSQIDRVSIDTNQDGAGERGTSTSAFVWDNVTTQGILGLHAQNSEPNGWKVIGSVFCDRNTPNGTAECNQMSANPTAWGGYRIGSDAGGHGAFQPVTGTGTKIRYFGPLVPGHTYKVLWIYDKTALPPDLCSNIPGEQGTVPNGLTRDDSNNCYACDGSTNPSATCGPPPPPPPPPPVPAICSGAAIRDAPIDRSSIWTDSYTDNNPDESGSTSPPNDGPREATTYRQITYEYSHTDVSVTAYDEWGQGVTTSYSESTTSPARIDYTNFARDYPYDFHTATVSYTVWYRQKTVDGTRTETAKTDNVYTYPAATAPATTPPPENYTTYSYGTWTTSESISYVGAIRSTSASQMVPCYDRKFDLVPTAMNSQLNDEENPTSVAFSSRVAGGYLAANDYGIGIRTTSHVDNFPVNGVYYVENEAENKISGDTPFSFGSQSASAGGSLSTNFTGFELNSTTSVSVSRPPLNYGDRVCFEVVLPDATGMMDQGGQIQGDPTSKQSSKACSAKIGDKPYFRVYGGDVVSGGSFQNNGVCPAPTSGNIFGHWRNGRGGAATGLAAIGLNEVNGVASASQRNTNPIRPVGLTFGNDNASVSVNTSVNQFGGNYGKTYCAPDYYSIEQFNDGDTRKNIDSTGGSINLNTPQFVNGGQTVFSSPGPNFQINTPTGITKRHTVFVNGNVTITSNLDYGTTSWADEKSIPYITVIARGNIYIDHSVERISGMFIAQAGNGQPGRIYTCKAWDDFARGPQSVQRCRTKLTINGSFVAQQVVLQRTTGTLSTANGEQEDASSANIAEVFNFSPQSYIGQPVFKPKATKYDSIKDLPPVL